MDKFTKGEKFVLVGNRRPSREMLRQFMLGEIAAKKWTGVIWNMKPASVVKEYFENGALIKTVEETHEAAGLQKAHAEWVSSVGLYDEYLSEFQ